MPESNTEPVGDKPTRLPGLLTFRAGGHVIRYEGEVAQSRAHISLFRDGQLVRSWSKQFRRSIYRGAAAAVARRWVEQELDNIMRNRKEY